MNDPLLCLTVSATLRQNALQTTHPQHPLMLYLASVNGLPEQEATSPTSPNYKVDDDELTGFEEINLLDNLTSGSFLFA